MRWRWRARARGDLIVKGTKLHFIKHYIEDTHAYACMSCDALLLFYVMCQTVKPLRSSDDMPNTGMSTYKTFMQ